MSLRPRTGPGRGPGCLAFLLAALLEIATAQAQPEPARVLFLYPAPQEAAAQETVGALRDLLADPDISLSDRAVGFELSGKTQPGLLASWLEGEAATLLVLGEFAPIPRFCFYWRDRRGEHLSERVLPSSDAGSNSRAEALSLIIRSLLESIQPRRTALDEPSHARPAGWELALVSGYRALYVPAALFTSHAGFVAVEASPGRPFWIGIDFAVHGRSTVSHSQVELTLQPWEVRLRGGMEQTRGRLSLSFLVAANVTFWAWRARSNRPDFRPVPQTTESAAGLEGTARLGVRLARWLELVFEIGLQLPILAQGFTVEEPSHARRTLLTLSPLNPFAGAGLRLPL